MILASNIENVRISRNLFSTAACGVSLLLPNANSARNVTIEHNTYHDLNSFLVWNGSNYAQDRIRFRFNLFHGDTNVLFDAQLDDLPPTWFEDNYWLNWQGGDLKPVAKPLSGFSMMSIQPDSPAFLSILASPDSVAPDPFPGRYSLPTKTQDELLPIGPF